MAILMSQNFRMQEFIYRHMKAVKSPGFTKLKSSAKCIGLLHEDKFTFDKKTLANILTPFLLLWQLVSLANYQT